MENSPHLAGFSSVPPAIRLFALHGLLKSKGRHSKILKSLLEQTVIHESSSSSFKPEVVQEIHRGNTSGRLLQDKRKSNAKKIFDWLQSYSCLIWCIPLENA